VLAFTASGDVADYSTELTTQIGQSLAGHEGVPTPESVSVEVEPGSVVITSKLSYEEEQSAEQARAALEPLTNDPEALEAFLRNAGLNVSVTEKPDLLVEEEPSGQEPSEPRTSSAFWPIVITAIVVAVLLIVLLALFLSYRSRKSRHEPTNTDASGGKQAGRLAVRKTPPPTRPSHDDSEYADAA
jgi:flagellar biosynthesis/type III secretory pathway M-ring protein FliF/YscJ